MAGTAENDHIALAEHLIPFLEFHRRKHVGKFFGIRKRLAARINLRRVLLHILEHQRSHLAKANNIHSAVFKVIKSLLDLLHRQKRDIAAELAQVRLGLDALGRMYSPLKQLIQGISSSFVLACRLVGTANLV